MPDATWELTENEVDLLAAYLRPIANRKCIEAGQDAERRNAGRYTLREAADAISAGTGERRKTVLARLIAAARHYELPMYEPGSDFQCHYPEPYRASAVRDFYEEARWNELNSWLEKYERHIHYRFRAPSAPPLAQAAASPAGIPMTPLGAAKPKARRDILDPAIDKAIERAGSLDIPSVWLKLKEFALEGEPPFTGAPKSGDLAYTDANDKIRSFTRDALGKRLRRRDSGSRPLNRPPNANNHR